MLARKGLIEDKSIEDNDVRKIIKNRNKKLHHNTLMLLKQYRNLQWMLECFPSRVAEELERPFDDIDELICAVNVEIEFSNKKLENRMFSIEKSRLLMDRLNESVSIL